MTVDPAPAHARSASKLTGSDRNMFKGTAAEVFPWMNNQEILRSIGCNFDVTPRIPTVDGREYPESRLWLRSDNGNHLGTFGNRRKVIQPSDFITYFRDFCEKSGKAISLDVVGTPDGGKTFYMASKLLSYNLQALREAHPGAHAFIDKQVDAIDRTDAWLIITDYYGESSAPRGLIYMNELVCTNGLSRRTTSKLAGLTHLRQQGSEDVSRVILSALEEVGVYQKLKQRLVNTKITKEFAHNCIRAFYRPAGTADNVAEKKVHRMIDLYENRLIGADLPTRNGTAWGLLQAITQHTTHGHIGDAMGQVAKGRAFKSLLDGARAKESRSFVDFLQAQLAAA